MRRASLAWAVAVLSFVAAIAPAVARADGPSAEQCVAANESAQSLRRARSLIAARAQLRVCVADACPGPVREDCAQRLDEVEKAIPTIVLEAKDAAGNDLLDVRVTVDGAPLTDKLDGKAVELEPGAHGFVFETAGQPPLSKQLVIREGVKDRHETVVLGAVKAAPAAAPAAEVQRSGNAALAITGFVTAGVGAIVGGITGSIALDKASSIKQQCTGSHCPANLASDASTATTLGNVSTVAFIVGALGLGFGIFELPRSSAPASAAAAPTIRIVIGPGSLGAQGAF
jgi:hypothetical protein